MVEYELDEGLISFGSCLERGQYAKAVDLLEELPLTPETEAMWRSLADASMEHFNLPVAERCYAVLGDVAKSRYLHKVNRLIQDHAAEVGGDGSNYYMAQAKMAMLAKQFQRAEAILLDHNELDEALAMYQELHKYNESIQLAERKNHPKLMHLKNYYLQWLLSTQQEEKAGELQEIDGDYVRLRFPALPMVRSLSELFRFRFSGEQSASQGGPLPRRGEGFAGWPAEQRLDTLAPGSNELVNVDVPNHWLSISRTRPTKSVSGGPGHAWGRSKRSKQKVEWRLKQGPPLAHKNWAFPSRLRVSTGTAKRRRLEQPAGVIVRPTMERVREALFNQVTAMHLFEDRSVRHLDLFTGTGSVGIEALSRGAAECVFVDSSKDCVDCAIANAWLCGYIEHEEASKGPMNERVEAPSLWPMKAVAVSSTHR
ncbi:IFT172 [Symbiodinium microadriaticum]|nr:IFT172 [Symbiodinium microadriaticum]